MPKGTFKNPVERSQKISLALKDRVIDDEWRSKMSEARMGREPWNKGKKGEYKLWSNGRYFSEETRKKMSESRLGKEPWNKGKVSAVLICERCSKEFDTSKSRVKEGRRFCSKDCYTNFNIGKNHHSWKGGITPINNKIRGSLDYRLWENSCKDRDESSCQRCRESRKKYLTVHHILNFAQYLELRFTIDNGITFCRNCHKEFHMLYKKKDNNKGQLKEFLKIG